MSWSPLRTLEQTDAVLCAPGHLHEIENITLDGRTQRVYKHLWPSLRSFWLHSVQKHAKKTCIVFENQRYTYSHVHQRAITVAAIFRHSYGIRKGDRVGICSRNCPDYLVSFWACHLLGAVPVLINAWLPLEPLSYCISHTECSLLLLDPERADRLAPLASHILRSASANEMLVFNSDANSYGRHGMKSFSLLVKQYRGEISDILSADPQILPEDNAAIMFTSGTTGLPKGVLSTQRQFLTNVLNVVVGGLRATLRRGEDYPSSEDSGPQKGILIPVPFFHVTGMTSFAMMAISTGMKIVLMSKWIVEDAVRLIQRENIRVAGGVPTMVADLTDSSLASHSLDGLLFGGSPAPDSLGPRARKAFPTAVMIQAYGLTETNSVAVSFAGEDYTARPTSTGRASPVNEIKIVHEGKDVSAGNVGEVWLRGPNVMKGYWREPAATAKVITNDGWLKTGDLGFLDEEGFLYIKDRIKDIIIRGGENIDSVSVENALYRDPRILEAAAVGVPDERLGQLVAAVVSIKPTSQESVTEGALIALARKHLPRFAVPVMIIVLDKPLGAFEFHIGAAFDRLCGEEHTPSGKIMKGDLRKLARIHWEERRQNGTAREPLANL